jgi:hypothetical protein
MFSRKNFSWKKWAALTLFLFVFTWLLAYFLGMSGETKQELLTVSSLGRRLTVAIGVGLLISFINAEPKQ